MHNFQLKAKLSPHLFAGVLNVQFFLTLTEIKKSDLF